MKKKFGIAIHGGAGTIKKSTMTSFDETKYLMELQHAVIKGYTVLQQGGSSLEAVEQTVRMLEDCPLFNAGKGSVFTHEGSHEMDASIMCGRSLKAGAVAAVKGIRNAVQLARTVMDNSDYVLLSGQGAEDFGRAKKLPFEEDTYFYSENRYNQWQALKHQEKAVLDHDGAKKFGTVGAVALDLEGNLAAATSTGGLTNKRYGRLGDSAIIGAGNYANNKTCAVSCTGYGEYFLRSVVAYDISCLMEYKYLTLKEACAVVLDKLGKTGGEGGFVAIDWAGNIELVFNTEGMYRGYGSPDSENGIQVAIYREG
jgi:L-asparaginase / beta-aspartyl-peptidase